MRQRIAAIFRRGKRVPAPLWKQRPHFYMPSAERPFPWGGYDDPCPSCGKSKPFLGPGHANRCGAPQPEGFGP